jgi:hypothetical protein
MQEKSQRSLQIIEMSRDANPDNDATIDAKELKTPAGNALLRLLLK